MLTNVRSKTFSTHLSQNGRQSMQGTSRDRCEETIITTLLYAHIVNTYMNGCTPVQVHDKICYNPYIHVHVHCIRIIHVQCIYMYMYI